MQVLICPDKFKGSLSAREVCQAIGNGLRASHPDLSTYYHPLADGGDGSLEILADHLQLKAQDIRTTDPLGREISTRYFTSSDAAFIELASAGGLVLLTKSERNPLATTTYGVGQMIVDALQNGYRRIYLFLGGSATNDAGMGIAAALGWQFRDANSRILAPRGENLPKVQSVQNSSLVDFSTLQIILLCDVTNPLYGPNGAAHVYARQKGATDDQVVYLDDGLRHFSEVIRQQTGIEVDALPGSGAAGGIGASLVGLCGATLESGFTAIAELTGLEKQIEVADWVISGEGRLDEQSLQGKVVSGVAALCQRHAKPLILFVGRNDLTETALLSLATERVYAITDLATDLEDAMANGARYLRELALRIKVSR